MLAKGNVRLVELYRTNLSDEFLVYTAVHEIGHALGCCNGPGTVDGHWSDPCTEEIMCASPPPANSDGRWPAAGHARPSRFSERELRGLGLFR